MVTNILKILTFTFFIFIDYCSAQEIYKESFTIPEKGIWGSASGTIQSDFSGITEWQLEYTGVSMKDAGDYAKTVSTSGGRFEVCHVEGEVTWRSVDMDISGYKNVSINLSSSETGNGTNIAAKYLRAYYAIDDGSLIQFAANGTSEGNWGSVTAGQTGLSGKKLRIAVKMVNSYSSDKVILDEVIVSGEKTSSNPPVPEFGLVVNELMIDPYPIVGLPEAEYIELYNTLTFPVEVENWILRINGLEKKLPKATISPGGFLVLCATGSLESLKQFGNVSNVPGFQGLLNSGALVELLDDKRNLIDRISYSESWYGDTQKANGGWSLERIDPLRNCNQTGNWQVSRNNSGGTPGKANSVFRNNPDQIAPFVRWAAAISENQIEIQFSEDMDSTKLTPVNFRLNDLGLPASVRKNTSDNIILTFPGQLAKNKVYTLEFQNITDDCGNKLTNTGVLVQWNTIEPGDILINEILFNPKPGGTDYVEIYNNSQKLIALNNLMLASRDDSLKLKQIYQLTKTKTVLNPGEYVALTVDTNKVYPFFRIECPGCFLQMEKFPSFNNEEGYVVILDKNLTVIDEFGYNEKMHSPLLSNAEGVALERTSIGAGTNEGGNWHSASTGSGYGTPGYVNSQVLAESSSKPVITFEPEAFSPDNDGYNDEYLIHYQLNKPGYSATIRIFDSSGRFILQLSKNEILGTEGTIKWNGRDETGKRLPVGMYVVTVEIFHESGEIHRYKDGVAITARFD